MRFAEAVQKMLEGKKMVNEKYPTIVYWFDKVDGRFLMKGESQVLVQSANFQEDEMKVCWKERESVETYVDGHDFVIKNFDKLREADKQKVFCALKGYYGR